MPTCGVSTNGQSMLSATGWAVTGALAPLAAPGAVAGLLVTAALVDPTAVVVETGADSCAGDCGDDTWLSGAPPPVDVAAPPVGVPAPVVGVTALGSPPVGVGRPVATGVSGGMDRTVASRWISPTRSYRVAPF